MDSPVTRNRAAVEVLRRLDEIGAIKIDVLLSKSAEIKKIIDTAASGGGGGAAMLDEWERICYPFYIRVGPRADVDLVTVAAELRDLGFEVKGLKR